MTEKAITSQELIDQANLIYEMQSGLGDTLADGLTEETLKRFRKSIDDALRECVDSAEWYLKDEFAGNLAWQVHEWFKSAFEAMLAGNEDLFRRYLHAEKSGAWTGRTTAAYSAMREHNIHGNVLFENGSIVLRKQLCDAYPELLKSERILDLEDQLKSVLKQHGQLEIKNAEWIARYNEAWDMLTEEQRQALTGRQVQA